mgnify:CR=1 FL=1
MMSAGYAELKGESPATLAQRITMDLSEVGGVSFNKAFLNGWDLEDEKRSKKQHYGAIYAVQHNIPYPSESPNFDNLPPHLLYLCSL